MIAVRIIQWVAGLAGLGALALAGIMGTRYMRLKRQG